MGYDPVWGWSADGASSPQNNESATTDPTVNDDADDGYKVGSRWYNLTTDTAFVLLDATVGAAQWKETTSQGVSTLAELTDVDSDGSTGDVLTRQEDGTYAAETPASSVAAAIDDTGNYFPPELSTLDARPNADYGSSGGHWNPSTGTEGYLCIDEASPSAGDYVTINGSGWYAFGVDVSSLPEGAVISRIRVLGSIEGGLSLHGKLRRISTGTDYTLVTSSAGTISQAWHTTCPWTGSAWTLADLQDLCVKWYPNNTASYNWNEIYQGYVQIEYTPAQTTVNDSIQYIGADLDALTTDVTALETGGLQVPFDAPEAGDQVRVRMPYAGTIDAWYLGGDDDIQIDVWKDTFANFPPTDADSITNSNEPALSSATTASATDLSGWSDTTFDAGDWLVFNVDSVGGSITYADLALVISRS